MTDVSASTPTPPTPTTSRPTSVDELWRLDATGQAELVANGTVTPIELVNASIDHAAKLGFRRTYLYTSGTLPAYYASLGWQAIEEIEYLGKMRTIMTFELA